MQNYYIRGGIGVALIKQKTKPIKMVWTFTKKGLGGTNEKSRLYGFQLCEELEREAKKDIGGSGKEGSHGK